jgi:two-component system cell cycle sensor histidine kinase/response regulator CckA
MTEHDAAAAEVEPLVLSASDRASARASKPRRRAEPLTVFAAVFFLLAVAAAAVPAFKAGPTTGPGLLLLIGLAGVAFLGVFAFATSEAASPAPAVEADAETLVEALSEPAAVAGADGRLIAANAAWETLLGGTRRLPKNGAGTALYAALASARRTGSGEARLLLEGRERTAQVARLGEARLLVRLPETVAPPARMLEGPEITLTEKVQPADRDTLALSIMAAAMDRFAGAAPFGAALLDGSDPFEATILEANASLGALTGGAAKPGVPFGALIDPASRAEAKTRLAAKPNGPVEVRLASDQSRIAQLFLARGEGRLTAYLLDVSEQKQLELQLAQSQKMQAIGQLAGGVAHDFNNLLTAIQLRLDELLHRHPVGDPSYEGLNEIRQTSVRAADLVRKLLAFSRKQTVQRETLDLGELISEFEVLLRRLLREDVVLTTDYGRDLPLVRADKSQLETAVMNLAVNARDALRSAGRTADGKPATVSIRTARLSRSEAERLGYPGAPDDGCALIEVADNGPGIPPDALAKIFEPFFTTKPVGEGTGLGLATVYGIVKQADGWIHVENQGAGGAAFRIFLPIHVPVAQPLEQPVRAPVKPKPAARDLSGAGRILFVEDEDAVRGVAARLLRARGYEVIEAADGEEALELAEQHAGEIDLLISDVIMPGLDGPTLLKKARGFLGDAPVMFISGYAEAEFSDLLEGETGVTFLAKPLDIKQLAERVKQQLQAA